MIANSTEVKNNFGKYLRMILRKIARLTSYDENYKKEDTGQCIHEGSVAYEMPPRKVT